MAIPKTLTTVTAMTRIAWLHHSIRISSIAMTVAQRTTTKRTVMVSWLSHCSAIRLVLARFSDAEKTSDQQMLGPDSEPDTLDISKNHRCAYSVRLHAKYQKASCFFGVLFRPDETLDVAETSNQREYTTMDQQNIAIVQALVRGKRTRREYSGETRTLPGYEAPQKREHEI